MPLPSASSVADAPVAAPPPGAPAEVLLNVGAVDLDAKDLLLLRSLLRLLDGHASLRLVHAEPAEACHVVFVPADWPHRLPPQCVVVRVGEGAVGGGLHVAAPLRSSNVGAVLRAAGDVVRNARLAAPAHPGLLALFQVLARHLAAQDRRCTRLPLADGRALVLDFEARVVRTPVPLATLLAGDYRVDAASRSTPAEREEAAAWPVLPLVDLFWRAAQRLGDNAVAGAPASGRYRLVRWPDAVALSRPGVPRLAALLTSRAMGFDEACTASGVAPAAVHWFLQAALALGLARPVPDDAPATSAASPTPPPVAAPATLLGRLRQHLKLW